ncbi:Hypothetical protein SCF082_LOCUS20977 [Durusdinium trenchii]|uniref:EF-hand domain-containing protein n=1 Tax=Durusdinium trenchii TaxID=1381693 RepID=A0ABP0L7E6_9DINO
MANRRAAFAWAQNAKAKKAEKEPERLAERKPKNEASSLLGHYIQLEKGDDDLSSAPGPRSQEALLAIFKLIDADGGGSISKLELIGAVYRPLDEDRDGHALVASFVLQGHGLSTDLFQDSAGQISINEYSFDVVDDIFDSGPLSEPSRKDSMAGGGTRVKYADFSAYFRRVAAACLAAEKEEAKMREIFRLIDVDGDGSVSKLELVAAMQNSTRAGSYLLPNVNTRNVLENETSYDIVCGLFDQIASGRKRISFQDFRNYLTTRFADNFDRTPSVSSASPLSSCSPTSTSEHADRSTMKLMILAPGFGQNPQQASMLAQAGYQLLWFTDLPEYPDEGARLTYQTVAPFLAKIRDEIQRLKPTALLCASQGGAYLVGLWQLGYWKGPSVMLNAHPSLPMRLPSAAPIVLAHGSNDEVYLWRREDLEDLVCTASPNRCLLYYTSNSGYLASGSLTRLGDRHLMQSILSNDCLPRLIDAAVSSIGPELYMLQTWQSQLGEDRREAQHWLGYSLERLRRFWTSPGRRGRDEKLHSVPSNSEEYKKVATIFRSEPTEAPAYMLSSQASWERLPIYKIERVENGGQMEGSAIPYRDGVRASLKQQGVDFDPSIHSCWTFHGADHDALMSIVRDPVVGFQPLISGSRNSPVWGSGTYFARDAKYVADGQFCPRRSDGLRCMLLCLVTMGIPCLGDPQQKADECGGLE